MKIVEYFLSIQGEGKYAGKLAVFVRFAGCNFNCIGFNVQRKVKNAKILKGCDTIKAVYTEYFKDEYLDLNPDELLEKILQLGKDKEFIVVITGGEPLIHHKDENFIKFVKSLLEKKISVHFETNASIFIDFDKYPFYKECIFAMGVKLSNSGVSKEKRFNFKALNAIIKNSKDSFYKIVLDEKIIENNKAQNEINELLSNAFAEIYCMPMGNTSKEIQKNGLKIIQFCLQFGYNYSDRIHIRLWENKEGV